MNKDIFRNEDIYPVSTSAGQSVSDFVEKVVDCDSLSLAATSCSYGDISCYVVNNDALFRQNHSMENFATSSAEIDSICVQNSTDVTFGNKTFFNGPIVIKNFIVSNNEEPKYSSPETSKRQESKQLRTRRKIPRKPSLLTCSIITTFLVAVIIVMVPVYFLKLRGKTPPTSDPSESIDDDDDYEFINRSQYGAIPSKVDKVPLLLPLSKILIARSSTGNCTNYDECVTVVLRLQYLHMNNGNWDDIGIHFLVGGDGRVYEGCGYTASPITNNKNILLIAFIGEFTDHEAPQKQLNAAQKFIDIAINLNEIDKNYILGAHTNIHQDNLLYNQVTMMPNWRNLDT